MFHYFTWDCKFSVLPFHLIVVKSVLNNNNVTIQHSFPSRPQQRHKQQKGASVVTPLTVFSTGHHPSPYPQSNQSSSNFSSFIRQKAAKDRIFRPIWWELPVVLGFLLSLYFLFTLERNWIGCGCVWLGDLRTVQCRVRSIDSPGLVSGSSLLIFFVCSLCRFRLFRSW